MANISSDIAPLGVGSSKGLNITAREIKLANNSVINTSTSPNSQGNAGDIKIATTGDIQISGYDSDSLNPNKSDLAYISSSAAGQGNAGKITINTQGKLSLLNNGRIISTIDSTAVGNSQGINITARSLELANKSLVILTNTFQTKPVDGKGNAGDINIKTTGDIKISGYDSSAINPTTSDLSQISSGSSGQGDTGKITIDTQGKFFLSDRGSIFSGVNKQANGNGRDISIAAREIELNNQGFILSGTDQIAQVNGKAKSGDIILQAKDTIYLKNISAISTSSTGAGQAGNVSVTGSRLLLNESGVLSNSASGSGGNVIVASSDKLLLRNSYITTSSGSSDKNGNGGNITISSPLIIALPGNNDIIANAYQGTGGKVNITSQGLFGIQYRPIGSEFTSDITASSTFGQSGTVNVETPGTDPGRDSTELPKVTTDASNQISQVCGANNRQNKLTVAGRGGIPPNANDPLTSDVVWQDARAASSQPVVSSVMTPVKFAPPAVGWVFDGKGKVTLIAAGTQGEPTGTSVVCPNVVGK